MGWIAASGSAVIAAFAIHSFLSRSNGARDAAGPSNQSNIDTDSSRTKSEESLTQKPPAPSPPVLLEVSPPVLLDVSPPSVVVKEDGFPLQLQHTESVPERPGQPSILMPPPPPPRARSSSPPRLKAPSFAAMPAPPRPSNGYVRPPPSAASSLRVLQTKALSNTSMAPSLGVPKKHVSKQAILAPGCSPLDWAALTSNPNSNLRGKDAPDRVIKVTPSMLKQQNGRKGRDAWTSYQGKVYNITPYLPFHPGGKGELMRGAGKDCGKLFMETHPWVNIDMLRDCLVGIVVAEDEAVNEEGNNKLDEMD